MFYVDIPSRECIGDANGAWSNVGTFKTKSEALSFIREHFGNCDDEGRISLITDGGSEEPK